MQINKAITQVERTLEKAEKNKGNMTEADWQNLEKELEEPLQVIANALESNKVSMMERVKLMTVATKWATLAMEVGLAELEKQTGVDREEWGNELEKALEGIDIGELQKALEGIDISELEKAAKEIEKALEGLQ